jgi:hypothetical protein
VVLLDGTAGGAVVVRGRGREGILEKPVPLPCEDIDPTLL